MKIEKLTVTEIRDGIKNGSFTAYEVITSLFKRIKDIDPKVQSYLTLCEESAIKKAKSVDEKIAKGEELGALCGVPIAIKDNICIDNVTTTCASKMLEDFIPPYDATVIKNLLKEDAIIIGKTNMDEFAMGSSTENSSFQVTKNPWDLTRVPGGSSGGSAACVAAGLAPISLGSDTGGSIRQPASFCGVVGLKPTYGLVSRFGLIAFGSSLEQIGPFAKNVTDAALTLQVIQGEDPLDSTTNKDYVPKADYLKSIDEGVKNMKIGVPKEFFSDALDEEVKATLLDSIEKLKNLGAEVEEFSLPITEAGLSAYYIISSAEASSNLARFDGIRYGYRTKEFADVNELMIKSRTEAFGPEVKRRIMLGTYALSSGYYDAYYKRAQKLQKKLKEEFKKSFEKYDIILSPTSPTPAFKCGERCSDPLQMYLADIYTININLAGVPALSLPYSFSKEGLPISVQIIGPHFGEEKIFKLAYALEKEAKVSTLAEI
ncbi:MAG: Asp-tRNA(Asn)/Glu-tRNA(Gln) amidotransferase subunit GatA [Clostridium sp.]|uniref:Asp-tRNA(Asn)/Glu-tRNA(Gln) amidotransferase subunit GatA n=1 Tax=Clostridium sp. DSM 8431 TaxID=1761781 RepID=UPI0008DEFA5F|nr:Asp-tRNA(Asn)/Glu-tRNA(Gln) amidotransferase subunit GatA [Clostridium sp. DSM 8431]MCR4944696.1 Asp-tRNA(Asn)/Glu-tRNA(Gln) amidotransferase subunit GatA [Clostridium sp.]SFU65081.1 aspartyl/glutamyl-tRNA(Asn/Gln) amidotransferase subunit A [Clostridium sp. DSM 8431]